MKKMITTAVAVVFVFVFTACGGISTSANNVNDEENVNDEIANNETSDEIVSDDKINWNEVGHEDEPCFPNDTCHKGLKCRNGKCVDDGGLDDTGKLNHPCYPDGGCRSDDMVCENGICIERSAQTDDDTVSDNIATNDSVVTDEEVDSVVTDGENMGQADQIVTDDDEVTPEANSIPDVDNIDPLTGIEAGHPCYLDGKCEAIKGLVCVEGTCQYPGTDTVIVDNDDAAAENETDVDMIDNNLANDEDVLVENDETGVDSDDTDIAPDTDTVPSNIGNEGQPCYLDHTCNGALVCIKGSEECANKPIAVPGQYEGRCWDWTNPLTGKTTCETEGWYWSPAIWAEASEQFPLCIGSSERRPYLAECQLQTASGEARSSVWYKHPAL